MPTAPRPLLTYLLAIAAASSVVATKYYSECTYNNHLDSRYGCKYNTKDAHVFARLIGSFSNFAKAHYIPFFLAHGTLLGHYWGNKTLPYDDDIDLQVTRENILNLSLYSGKEWNYNNTMFVLDVNPNWITYPAEDEDNVIDARWIDTSTGLFIDITAVHNCADGNLCVRNHHRYNPQDLFPLVPTEFFGMPVFVPNNTEKILSKEYGQHCTNTHEWRGFSFIKNNEGSRYWIKT
jgi:phosphorylcholine metabolism protein LicD